MARDLTKNDLKPISIQELSRHVKDGDTWVSILGYVINVGTLSNWLEIYKGRDSTTRYLMQFHDIPMDINDDRYTHFR